MKVQSFVMRFGGALLLVAFALGYLAVGVTWSLRHIGEVPAYDDSRGYAHLAETLRVDEYRGIVYPALLAGAAKWTGKKIGGAGEGAAQFQIFQLMVNLVALAYFLYVFAQPVLEHSGLGRQATRAALLLLLFLLMFDPLVAHFNMSILTDGLALSGSLVFCAALADLGVRRSPPSVSGTLLFLSFLFTAGLRAEKNWVLLGTGLSALALWRLWQRRSQSELSPGLRGRMVAALLIIGVAFSTVSVVHRGVYEDLGRWPIWVTIAHHRFIYPHLASVYRDLPPEARRQLNPADAVFYDTRIHNTWAVIKRSTKKDRVALEKLTVQLLGPVLRAHWQTILRDIATDTGEHVLATPSFYARLAHWMRTGASPVAYEKRFEATPWTYTRLVAPQPELGRRLVQLSLVFFLTCLAVALARLFKHVRTHEKAIRVETRIAAVPVSLFCLINALAFSLTADLVHIRYVIFAHVAGLLLVYLAALLELRGRA